MKPTELKAFRKKMGFTQRALANWLGTKYRTVVAWENEQNPVPDWAKRRIAEENVPKIDPLLEVSVYRKAEIAAKNEGKSLDEWIADLIKSAVKLWLLGWLVASLFERTRCDSWLSAVIAGGGDMCGAAYAVAAFSVEAAVALVAAIVG